LKYNIKNQQQMNTKDTLPDNQVKETTTVDQIDVDIDAIFGTPGAESIMLPDNVDEPEKKSVFTAEKTDMTFFDNPSSKTSDKQKDDEDKQIEVEETIAELDNLIAQEEDAGNKGRPKVDKSGLFDLAQKMIEEGSLIPFDDDKPLEDYTTKDFRELFEANFQEREAQIRENTPKEFFQSLPQELQYAAKYVADGGQDLKSLFRTLAHVEEIRQLDPSNEYDQAEIARQYLYATQFGTPEEIEAEITDWSELGRLGQKANQFKPKLDKMQEDIVNRQLAEQEYRKQQQAEQARAYQDNVYNTLVSGELGGVKLDKKIQSQLYSGLVQPNYPSISGKPTNQLGHLLEKYQFVEPRHDLIAEALWLLSDPEGYRSKIKEQGGRQATEKAVRQLKTEEARKNPSSTGVEEQPQERGFSRSTKTISRSNNMFKRF
jgi:hypothetical protein